MSQYDRLKGAPWFDKVFGKEVLVIGAGGISSWTSVLLARAAFNLTIYDDDRYESHNMSGQFCTINDIGSSKTEALANNIELFSPASTVNPIDEKYTEDSPANDIVVCGLDNMKARKIAFNNWIKHIEDKTQEEKAQCYFIDGRLSVTHAQIYSIRGDQQERIERYSSPEILFKDDEVEEDNCTYKQTSHMAAYIASKMCNFLISFVQGDIDPPFFDEYCFAVNINQKSS